MEIFLLIIKVTVFFYIIISPLIDHRKYVPFMESYIFKVILLLLILATTFVDFQLALLLTIALFIIIINFSRYNVEEVITKTNELRKVPLYVKQNEIIKPETIPNQSIKPIRSPIVPKNDDMEEQIEVSYPDGNMYDFPDASCNTKDFDNSQISDNLLTYYLDEKTKPYEIYIRMLTNAENLHNVQTNIVE